MTASLRALLDKTIDYAGLFPPASLTLDAALWNHAKYIRSPDAWMLGAFVLPLSEFEEAAAGLSGFDVQHRLAISALGAKTEGPAEFIKMLETGATTISRFTAQYGAIAGVDQVEIPLARQPGATIADAYDALAGINVPVFVEAPPDDAERTIAALAEHRSSSAAAQFGFKLRTGGVIASAFPSSMQIARALIAAIHYRVPIKFTAGLHHPVRQFQTSVQTKMHGFLNVFGAGVQAAEHRWDSPQTAAMLDDEDPTLFEFTDDFFRWQEWQITTDRIREHRTLVTSFGSCSFDEPRHDLLALDLN
ncbi:MAG: hypothetical protein H0X73_05855 [Chthoniobacterales bacterium]|nr:hypothetical protein [Chthoniobacterales bacterium]